MLLDMAELSAAPEEVRMAFTSLADTQPTVIERLDAGPGLAASVVSVLAASRSLTRLVLTESSAIDVLANLDRPVEVKATGIEELARRKRLELLRIAGRDLLGLDSLEEVACALANLADAVLAGACQLAQLEGNRSLAVIGMGKLGGQELNYSSDVDVMFVGRPITEEAAARDVMRLAGQCFRVDANLRPGGRSGSLVRTVSSYRTWWERWSLAWETQALIKARPVAGEPPLLSAFMEAATQQVWGKPFGAEELRQVREMKAKAERVVEGKGLTSRELKRGYGGIRDIEFSVQLLQLVHGRNDPTLRSRSTLPALKELGSAGYIDPDDAEVLDDAYRFLRTVEHRLQLVEESQTHTVPEDGLARTRLARVMGYKDEGTSTALDAFDEDLARYQTNVRAIHERLFFRPLLEAFAGRGQSERATRPTIREDAIAERLAAFGFTHAEQTRAAFEELTRGLSRSSRLMEQMLPLILDWLSVTADPDLGLLGLRNLAAPQHLRQRLVATFRDSPEAARRLCILLGTGRLLTEAVRRDPELIPTLGDDASLVAANRKGIESQAKLVLGLRQGEVASRRGLLRLKQSAIVRVATRDLLDLDGVAETGAALTNLAEGTLSACLEEMGPPLPMAIVAMGRLGGAELSYASDLDLMLVCADTGPAGLEEAIKFGESFLRVINGFTPAERIFTLDANLRPEGKDGPMVRSLAGYGLWYERWAKTWERQALLRARPIGGDPELGQAFMEVVNSFVWDTAFGEAEEREIRRIKARMETERIPPGEDPQFHLKLGRGSLSDVEWTAQLLQLRNRVRSTGTMEALRALAETGAMSTDDAAVLAEAYRFCERTRNRRYLVGSAASDSLPTQAGQLRRLARSLGATPTGLREEYRRLTRRARQVMERLFYNMTPEPS